MHRDPPISVPQVLGIKLCTTGLTFFWVLNLPSFLTEPRIFTESMYIVFFVLKRATKEITVLRVLGSHMRRVPVERNDGWLSCI